MSRRHHGGRPHRANGPGRPVDTSRPIAPAASPLAGPATTPPAADERLQPASESSLVTNGAAHQPAPMVPAPAVPPPAEPDREGGEPSRRMDGASGPMAGGNGAMAGSPAPDRNPAVNGGRTPSGPLGSGGACTAPQLRRFIKSRPYVPMHELRRRFAIDGGEDDVTPVDLANGRIFVGLPQREGSLLGELLRGGEVGFELSMDPRSPVVIGLYPMRPVART